MPKFTVTLGRVQHQILSVEVEADSEAEAESIAQEKGDRSDDWDDADSEHCYVSEIEEEE